MSATPGTQSPGEVDVEGLIGEIMREADAAVGFNTPLAVTLREAARMIAALRAERDQNFSDVLHNAGRVIQEVQARERAERERDDATSYVSEIVPSLRARADALEAERDALRERCERLEAGLKNMAGGIELEHGPGTVKANWPDVDALLSAPETEVEP